MDKSDVADPEKIKQGRREWPPQTPSQKLLMARAPPETAHGLGLGVFSTPEPRKVDIRDVECIIRGGGRNPL